MIDIGCGSGQSTHQLSSFSKQVIGTDISQAQIDCAIKSTPVTNGSNMSFKMTSAYQLPVEDGSVSMVTCGQAWHWLEPTLVNPEILRVLKNPGVIAIYGHMVPLIDDEKCRELIMDFYSNTLKGYWHSNRSFIDDYYHSISLPLPLSERHDIEVTSTNSLEGYIAYLDTWSGYKAYLKANPSTNVLNELKEKLKSVLPTSKTDNLSIVTPYFLSMCVNK